MQLIILLLLLIGHWYSTTTAPPPIQTHRPGTTSNAPHLAVIPLLDPSIASMFHYSAPDRFRKYEIRIISKRGTFTLALPPAAFVTRFSTCTVA